MEELVIATELGVAYISILPETSKLAPGITKAFGGVSKDADRAGTTIGSRMSGALGSALKTGALVAGTAAVGLLGTALYKGFNRLTGIENATAKLTGLGHSAESVRLIMDNALASVKGTAFGLADAATVAATTVASGVKPGKDLERILRLVADSATIAGTDLGSMGAIFSKVAASNKIQGDVIAQLNDAGIPIVQLLGKELGKTASEVVEMASAGEIGFATFADAMEAGLGGAAQESGATLEGAFANVQAALGRIGAGLLVGVFPQIKGFFNGSIDLLGTLEGRAQEIGQKIGDALAGTFAWVGPKIRELAAWVTGTLAPAIVSGAAAAVTFGADLADKVAPTLRAIAEWITGTVVPALKEFFTSSTFLDGLSTMWETLGSVTDSVVSVFDSLWPALKQVGEMLGDLFVEMKPALVAGLKTAFVGLNIAFRVAGKIVAGLASAVAGIVDWFYRWQDVLVPLLAGVTAFLAVLKAYQLTLLAVAAVQRGYIALLAAWRAATLGVSVAIWAMNGALLANPIVLVVAAVAALVAAFVVAYKKSEEFRNIVNGAWAAIQIAAQVALDFFTKTIPAAMEWIWAKWTRAWNGMEDNAVSIALGLVTWFTGLPGRIVTALATLGADLKSKAISGFTEFVTGAKEVASDLWTWVSGIPGRVLEEIGDLGSTFYEGGKELIQGLIDGIGNKLGELRSAMGAVGTLIAGFLPGSPVREGPLTSWNNGGAGKRLMGFLADGIEAGAPGVHRAAWGVADGLNGTAFAATASVGVTGRVGAGVDVPVRQAPVVSGSNLDDVVSAIHDLRNRVNVLTINDRSAANLQIQQERAMAALG